MKILMRVSCLFLLCLCILLTAENKRECILCQIKNNNDKNSLAVISVNGGQYKILDQPPKSDEAAKEYGFISLTQVGDTKYGTTCGVLQEPDKNKVTLSLEKNKKSPIDKKRLNKLYKKKCVNKIIAVGSSTDILIYDIETDSLYGVDEENSNTILSNFQMKIFEEDNYHKLKIEFYGT